MADVQQTDNGGAIVGDDVFTFGLDELVHSARAEGCLQNVSDSAAGVDVADDLVASLRVVGSVPQKQDLGLLVSLPACRTWGFIIRHWILSILLKKGILFYILP
jgi:hypothetical protein